MNRCIRTLSRAGLGLVALAATLVVPATAASANYSPQPGDEGPFYIVNVANNRCLDAAAQGQGANGTRVQIWDCYPPTQYNQMWRLHPTAQGSWIQGDQSHRVLDAAQNGNGSTVQLLYLDSGIPGELWTLKSPNQF